MAKGRCPVTRIAEAINTSNRKKVDRKKATARSDINCESRCVRISIARVRAVQFWVFRKFRPYPSFAPARCVIEDFHLAEEPRIRNGRHYWRQHSEEFLCLIASNLSPIIGPAVFGNHL